MKYLLVTVAGIAGRFNEGYAEKYLKCIYYVGKPQNTLLYRILDQNRDYDRIVIVGGYLYKELKEYVQNYLADLKDKIVLLNNVHYKEYGSAYSLKLGLEACLQKADVEEIFFTEGDLYVGTEDYQRLKEVRQDIFTFNHERILAEKAVVVYRTKEGWHYAFDTNHQGIVMPGTILEIYNSAQMWKFCNIRDLKAIYENMPEEEWRGTNLTLIQTYFRKKNVCPVEINEWVNCNTRADYLGCTWRS